jgi:hypothetical protein
MANPLIPDHFFLDDKLHKRLAVVRSEDYIVTFSYEDEKQMRFSYSLIRKTYKKAFLLKDVGRLLEISPKKILTYVNGNFVPRPKGMSYHIASRRPNRQYWTEEDVLYLRDKIYELAIKDKYGKTRKDIISRASLLAKMHGDSSYYVKTESGDFVKVWKNI